MALIKKGGKTTANPKAERRQTGRDLAGLAEQLVHESASERRHAARDLADFPESLQLLSERIEAEPDRVVRQAILDSMMRLGGQEMIDLLIPRLNSEDAGLRNSVIEVLQNFPEEMAPRIATLLNDPDSDVRIFAVDVLQLLAHPSAPDWLLEVIRDEEHVNVVAAALDRLAEIGTPEMIPDIEAVSARFPGEPFIDFSVEVCKRRVGGASA